MRPMPRSTATPSPPASNDTSMRRDCCDVDAPAGHASVAGAECSAHPHSVPPHTMVDTGQDGPLQAHALHRTAHPTRLASRS
jgi:hypothetical protein